jgi:chemosensory pili system protein ChpA (sensor histidine kinase/response regulator)
MEVTSDTGAMAEEVERFLSDFDTALRLQRRLTNEIQDCLMSVRMLPLRVLVGRLQRTVRMTAEAEQKQVLLEVEGEATEMDTTIVEHIADSLLHLLRNAVAHGIETAERRRSAGKPGPGVIRLSAWHEGTDIVLQVRDDGAGLDVRAIREKAVSLGLVARSKADAMADSEVWRLVLAPGLSTAGAVNESAGRGIGLDVVRETLEKLHGSIAIDSAPGKWTSFTLRLPMTLTVTGSVLVQVSGTTYAVPLDAVQQILRWDTAQSHDALENREFRFDGTSYVPFRLADALQLPVQGPVTGQVPVLLMQLRSEKAAVIVDKVLGGREIVVKPLGTHLKRVRGILGATMLGDGRVVPIINPADLAGSVPGADAASRPAAPLQPSANPAAPRALTIMIVDDSPSVRRVNSTLVKNAGWIPVVAKDGLDALEQLRHASRTPDVVLLDIEMPRMDGYEFLANLRGQEKYRYLPVIMITSRMSEKHRKKAMDLGVSEYLTKPYTEDILLGHIRRLAQ